MATVSREVKKTVSTDPVKESAAPAEKAVVAEKPRIVRAVQKDGVLEKSIVQSVPAPAPVSISEIQSTVTQKAVETAKPAHAPVASVPQMPQPVAKPVEKPLPKVKMPSLQQFLEAGAHFGHKVSRWNPAMREYIFDTRAGMHVIDLTKTLGMLEDAVNALAQAAQKGNILLVGTKGQAATIVKNAGTDHGAFFVSRRWPGGMLTNFKIVHKSVRRLMEIEEDLASGRGYETKHERLVLERERDRLAVLYEGIRFMDSMPVAIVVIDTKVEKNAIKEARKIGVPVFAIIDTNCDPRLVEFPIPGNDDAIKSIDLFMGILVQAFTSTETSSRLIGQRNDYHTRIEQIRRQREAEEERKRKEREYEIARLKAMKEGKTVDMPAPDGTDEGKVVRVMTQGNTGEVEGEVREERRVRVELKAEKKGSAQKSFSKTKSAEVNSALTVEPAQATPAKSTTKPPVKKPTKKAPAKKSVTKKSPAKKSVSPKPLKVKNPTVAKKPVKVSKK